MSARTSRVTLLVGAAIVVVAGAVLSVVLTSGDDAASPSRSTTTGKNAASATTTTGSTAPATTAPVNADGTPGGHFTIVGRQIVDPDGNVFVPMGANIAVRIANMEHDYTFNWNGTGTDHVADVKAWGWNTVRPTLICNLDGSGPTADDLNTAIDAFIQEYTTQRVVVIVECHDLTAKNATPDDPRVTSLTKFWDRLATKWHDNPYVWFNPYNEPQSNATPDGVANWMALQRQALGQLRAIAPTSVFVADIPGAGQGLATLDGADSITQLGKGQCNVLYDWHAYGAAGNDDLFGKSANWDVETKSLENHRLAFNYLRDHDIPMVIGEFGDPLTLNEGTAGQPIWNRNGARAVIDLAPQYGVGLLWWHATGDSSVFLTYSLMADRHQAPWSAATSGDGLSDGGKRFWEASKAQPAPTKFTGDLAAGNCG